MSRLARLAALVLLTLLGLGFVWLFRTVIVLFALSLAVAATLRPLVDRQVAHGWPRILALVFIYALAIGFFGVLLWSLGAAVIEELRVAVDNFILAYDQAWSRWPEGTSLQQAVAALLPPPEDLYDTIAGPRGEAMVQGLLGVGVSLFDVLSRLAIVIVLSLYWSVDQARFERVWLSALPAERRASAREVWRTIETRVGAYICSESTLTVFALFLLALGYSLIGLQFPVLLAVFAAVAWLVPWLGLVVGLVPVVLVGLAGSAAMMAAAVLYTVLLYAVFELLLEPRVKRRQYSPLLEVLTMIALGIEFGLVGVLVAPAVAVALQVVITTIMNATAGPAPVPRDQLAGFEERLQQVRAALAQSPEPSPALVSMADRLEQLIHEAGQVAVANGQAQVE